MKYVVSECFANMLNTSKNTKIHNSGDIMFLSKRICCCKLMAKLLPSPSSGPSLKMLPSALYSLFYSHKLYLTRCLWTVDCLDCNSPLLTAIFSDKVPTSCSVMSDVVNVIKCQLTNLYNRQTFPILKSGFQRLHFSVKPKVHYCSSQLCVNFTR